jgi:DNA-binding CsgD family transcriptional regulator
MGDTRADNPARHRAFVTFLHSYGAQDAAEMIFSYRGKAVAGLSIVWTQRRCEHRPTVELGGALQNYIEFNLGTVWPDVGAACGEPGSAEGAFTSREKEVLDVVCRGFTNEQIAWHLNISVATVKTHLIHIFKKTGVETRGELISRVLSTPHATASTQPSG